MFALTVQPGIANSGTSSSIKQHSALLLDKFVDNPESGLVISATGRPSESCPSRLFALNHWHIVGSVFSGRTLRPGHADVAGAAWEFDKSTAPGRGPLHQAAASVPATAAGGASEAWLI